MQHGHARHGPVLQWFARNWTTLQWTVGQLRCAVLCCGHGLVQEQLPDSEAIRLGMDGVIGTGCERRGGRLKK